jgi:hypothetical protein
MEKSKIDVLVIGAGVGGLAAGSYLKSKGMDFVIVERSDAVPNNLRNGMHYLHSTELNLPFELKFKQCKLTENIWDTRTNTFKKEAMIPEIFEYSQKVMENLRHPSSIMDPGENSHVFVPESNDMNELIDKYKEYIGDEKFLLSTSLSSLDTKNKIAIFEDLNNGWSNEIEYKYLINTSPIDKFLKLTDITHPLPEENFKSVELFITNYETVNITSNWMIGLYMSDPKFPPYRISCFNNLLSMESLSPIDHDKEVIIKYIIGDLFDYELKSKQEYSWKTGRIFGVDKLSRKEIVDALSAVDIYSIGRYGLWNGKLRMDDTIHQAEKIVESLWTLGFPTVSPEIVKEQITKKLYE